MKQITQTLRTGDIEVQDVPIPTLRDNFILVRNEYSVISAGTEKTKIDMGNKNLIQKALARPDLVKQVVKKLKTEGLGKTLQTVNSRLDSPSPLGYSCAGEVVAVGGMVVGIKPGDKVACGGQDYANHADYVSIPKNLVVKIPESVSVEEAAFTTIGSIALQGVRLAAPRIGETFLVIGLGLVGQITAQILKANGCKVLGMDLDEKMLSRAASLGITAIPADADPSEYCLSSTKSNGVDGVLICAGTASNTPIELSGEVTRNKGRVIVVGAVRMDIPREPYFKKEIELVISRSYGPGRYDPFYEESGNDYPYGYVRFTEQRNMETFLDLVASQSINIKDLVTHRFEMEQVGEAYQLIEGEKKESYLGITLKYSPSENEYENSTTRISINKRSHDSSKSLKLSFYGAGNYATASLLPVLKNQTQVEFAGLVTASGRTAQGVAAQFGFSYCAANYVELLSKETDIVFICSRHNDHATSVVKAYDANKHVYVEKPIALTVEELKLVNQAVTRNPENHLMIGFNRRFSPLTEELQTFFSSVNSPLVINIRVNAGAIPVDHWIQDPIEGGGRIIGEGCHFVDLAQAIANSDIKTVFSQSTGDGAQSALLNDNVVISLGFANGSIANIIYTSSGSSAMSKEYIEVFGGGKSAVLDDFKTLTMHNQEGNTKLKKLSVQDKGQRNMLEGFIKSIRNRTPLISQEKLMNSSLAVILAIESQIICEPITVNPAILEM